MAYELKPPFETYHTGLEIADANGHLCTAESPEIAQAILAALVKSTHVSRRLTADHPLAQAALKEDMPLA